MIVLPVNEWDFAAPTTGRAIDIGFSQHSAALHAGLFSLPPSGRRDVLFIAAVTRVARRAAQEGLICGRRTLHRDTVAEHKLFVFNDVCRLFST